MRDALAFLTVLPVGVRHHPPGRLAALAFPPVGLAVGGAWVAVGWSATSVWGPLAGAALVLLADLVLTGALHLDAFADVADGVASRRRGEDAIAVMRDPAVGAVGAAALVVALVLRLAFVFVLLEAAEWRALLAAPVAGRSAMVWLMARGCCTSERSLASSLCAACSVPLGLSTVVLAAAIAYTVAEVRGLMSVLLGALVAEILAVFFRRRFGGITGDACGATGFVAEIAGLALLSVRPG